MSAAPTDRQVALGRGRERARAVRVAAAAAALGVALAGCSSAAPLPPQPTTVEVTMRDHAFELDRQPPLPAGRVVFHAHNAGDVPHELAVVDLPDDPSPDAEPQAQAVPTVGVIHARPPGKGGRVAVDLGAGRYALVCLLRDDSGLAHSRQGQRVVFEVR